MIKRELFIAWLQLRFQKPQTFAAIASIIFITLLLFMQIGYRDAFLNALIEIPRKLRGDLFMFHASTQTALYPVSFPQQQLCRVLAFPDVESIMPIYVHRTSASDPLAISGFVYSIHILGFPVSQSPLDIPELDHQLHLLKENRVFLMDELSRHKLRQIIKDVDSQGYRKITLGSHTGNMNRVVIKGLFSMGINETISSNMLTGDATFMEIFKRKRQDIDIGVIHLKPGTNADSLQKKLKDYLPSDIVIRQKNEILADEREMFESGMPIGVAFRTALGVSIFVGIIVLYQVLFQITSKHLRDYAVLKALGFTHTILLSIVFSQAVILAVLGYIPGLALSFYFYGKMTQWTSLQHSITVEIADVVFAMTASISLISAMFAIRKLREADPADLFE